MARTGVLVAAALAACVAFTGCAKKVSIEEGKAKIEELAARGVPEREMSTLKMYLFQMETAKMTGNSSVFRVYQDSLTHALAEFDGKMSAILENAGPYMDSLRRACDDKIAQLKGLHLEAAQKGKGPVDSLMQIESQKLYARGRLDTWALDLDTLVMQQKLADSLRKEFVGMWAVEKESPDKRYNVVEWTQLHMKPDGSLLVVEGKKGKTSDESEEDWLYESTGTWDLLGDVAYHYITREKCVRNIFKGIDPSTGKWRTMAHPTYDSTVTKGTKDRYAAWDALNKDYKRFPFPKGKK